MIPIFVFFVFVIFGQTTAADNSVIFHNFSLPDDYLWTGIRSKDFVSQSREDVFFTEEDILLRSQQFEKLKAMTVGEMDPFWKNMMIGVDSKGNECSRSYFDSFIFHSKAVKTSHRQFLCLKSLDQIRPDYVFEPLLRFPHKLLANGHVSVFFYLYDPKVKEDIYFVWFEAFNMPKTFLKTQRSDEIKYMRKCVDDFFSFVEEDLESNVIETTSRVSLIESMPIVEELITPQFLLDPPEKSETGSLESRRKNSVSEGQKGGAIEKKSSPRINVHLQTSESGKHQKKKPKFTLPLTQVIADRESKSSPGRNQTSPSSSSSPVSSDLMEEDRQIVEALKEEEFQEFLKENPFLLREVYGLYELIFWVKSQNALRNGELMDTPRIDSPKRDHRGGEESGRRRREKYSLSQDSSTYSTHRNLGEGLRSSPRSHSPRSHSPRSHSPSPRSFVSGSNSSTPRTPTPSPRQDGV